MAVNWSTTAEMSVSHGVKGLVYARAGIGKTMLAATLPAPVMVSVENGALSLSPQNIARVWPGAKDVTADIPVMRITCFQDLSDTYEWLTKSPHRNRFKSIYMDSISEIAEVVLADVRSKVKDGRQQFGAMYDEMVRMVKAYRDISGMHVFMSAKHEMIKDDTTGVVQGGPLFPGKALAKEMPYIFDEMFYMDVGRTADGKPYRYLKTQPDAYNDAKDRSGALADIEQPHLGRLITKIMSSNTAK